MKRNLAKFELLYDDLINHSIGSYFKSRDFKVLLTSKNAIAFWNDLYNEASKDRRFYSLGMDVEEYDSEEAFRTLIELSDDNEIVKELLINIISNFIENYKEKNNFSNLIQSLELSGFSNNEIKNVKESIEILNSKSFMENNIKVNGMTEKLSQKEKDILGNKSKVFIVHGHNDHLKVEVARTLEKFKLKPIILHEQSNNGKTIIEKFEKFSDVSFAVILLTADDLGNSKNNIDTPNKRARQNVIFELGYFIGKLGRENVMTLKEEGVEVPNDISGVVYTPYDQQGSWKYELGKELKSASFKIDMNDLFN